MWSEMETKESRSAVFGCFFAQIKAADYANHHKYAHSYLLTKSNVKLIFVVSCAEKTSNSISNSMDDSQDVGPFEMCSIIQRLQWPSPRYRNCFAS